MFEVSPTTKTRDEMIDRLVADDVRCIKRNLEKGDQEFLESVLRGRDWGWLPYSELTDAQISEEYDNREFEDDVS